MGICHEPVTQDRNPDMTIRHWLTALGILGLFVLADSIGGLP